MMEVDFILLEKIYFLLFNFIIGKQTKKFSRFRVHLETIMLFVFSPFWYYIFFVQLFTVEIVFTMERLIFLIVAFLVPMLLACLVKFIHFLENG